MKNKISVLIERKALKQGSVKKFRPIIKQELANVAGVSLETISRYDRDETKIPSSDLAEKMMSYFKCKESDLISA